jgi:hypothetical protein
VLDDDAHQPPRIGVFDDDDAHQPPEPPEPACSTSSRAGVLDDVKDALLRSRR